MAPHVDPDRTAEGTEISVVARGTRVEGKVAAAGSLRVEGEVKGAITAKGDVWLSPQRALAEFFGTSPKVAEVLPLLYLHGLSTKDFVRSRPPGPDGLVEANPRAPETKRPELLSGQTVRPPGRRWSP